MKTYICILASAALLGACEQKTETIQPTPTPARTAAPVAAGEYNPGATTESPAEATQSPAPSQSPPSS